MAEQKTFNDIFIDWIKRVKESGTVRDEEGMLSGEAAIITGDDFADFFVGFGIPRKRIIKEIGEEGIEIGGRNYLRLIEDLKKVKNPTDRQKDYLKVSEEIIKEAKLRGYPLDDVISHKIRFPKDFELAAKELKKKGSKVMDEVFEAVGKGTEAVETTTKGIKSKVSKEASALAKRTRDLVPEGDITGLARTLTKPVGEAAARVTGEGLNPVATKILKDNALRIAGIKTVRKLVKRFGMGFDDATNMIKSEKVLNKVKDVSKLKVLGVSVGGLTLAQTGFALGGTAVGLDLMTNWAALDNVMGQQSILIRDVTQATLRGELSTEDANALIAESERVIAVAESKIESSFKWDPFAIISKKIWQAGIDSTKLAIDVNKELINIKSKDELPTWEGDIPSDPESEEYQDFKRIQMQQPGYAKAEEAQARLKRQKELDQRRATANAAAEERRKLAAKQRSKVPITTQSTVQYEKKRQKSKLGFGL